MNRHLDALFPRSAIAFQPYQNLTALQFRCVMHHLCSNSSLPVRQVLANVVAQLPPCEAVQLERVSRCVALLPSPAYVLSVEDCLAHSSVAFLSTATFIYLKHCSKSMLDSAAGTSGAPLLQVTTCTVRWSTSWKTF